MGPQFDSPAKRLWVVENPPGGHVPVRKVVIPAIAGIHLGNLQKLRLGRLDSRLCGNDRNRGLNARWESAKIH